jgi:NAD(P)-dependent dehydrogenase (short-subunit alcohol dehydrogenase family)
MMSSIQKRFSSLDVVFANAGMFRAAAVADIDAELIDQLFATNFKGAFFTFQKALPLLSFGASVIFNTSAMMHIGVRGAGVYSASKAALRALVRTIALEFGPRVRVNVISPGSIATPLHQHSAPPPELVEKVVSELLARTPLQRFGEAEEVARAALFLASNESAYIQGEEITVAGGWSAV